MLGTNNEVKTQIKIERAKTIIEGLSFSAFMAIAREWPENLTQAIFGSIAGAEAMQMAFDDSEQKMPNNIMRALVLGGVGTAVIGGTLLGGASIFTGALTLRTATCLYKAYNDKANRWYHLLDAGIGLTQGVTVGMGLVANVAKKTNMYVAASAAAVGTLKGMYNWFRGGEAKGGNARSYQQLDGVTVNHNSSTAPVPQ